MAVRGGSAIMSRSAWSRGERYDHAPLYFGDTALQYFRQVDQLEHTHGARQFSVYDLISFWVEVEYCFYLQK